MRESKNVSPPPVEGQSPQILVSAMESRARDGSGNPWVAMPINDQDLSQGYKEISFRQLNNYTNHAAKWLSENLPASSKPFQCFAYAGPKDLRYPILALAAAKLQKVIVLPSPLVTPEGQKKILRAKECGLYLRTPEMTEAVSAVINEMPDLQCITVPDLKVFMNEETAPSYTYQKSWEEANDDPWIVFHSSGTTGFPKPLTYTQHMMAMCDIVMKTPGMEDTWVHNFGNKRLYTPLPSLHIVGMFLVLCTTTCMNTVSVLGPPGPHAPETIMDVLKYGQADTAVLAPALIEEICRFPDGLDTLRNLSSVQYAGAPLAKQTGDLLASHTRVMTLIGSTEAGGYFAKAHDKADAWDYAAFHERIGAVFERRFNDVHELVFVRQPGNEMQIIFKLYPELERYETKDLWTEHPVHKGLWKIIGRADDHVSFSHGDGLHASRLEPEIEAHPAVKSALIGGHGHPAPVLLIELYPDTEYEDDQASFIATLQPYIDKVNGQVHNCVKLSTDWIVMSKKEKPFARTLKGSVSRVQTIAAYKDDIAALFA